MTEPTTHNNKITTRAQVRENAQGVGGAEVTAAHESATRRSAAEEASHGRLESRRVVENGRYRVLCSGPAELAQ